MASKQGILDLDVVDYEMVFDTKVNLNLRKADRLIYGDSEMNHAMVLTGVHVEVRHCRSQINLYDLKLNYSLFKNNIE